MRELPGLVAFAVLATLAVLVFAALLGYAADALARALGA